jgi:pimeloyl-ACP methyl ester carboxylesterase
MSNHAEIAGVRFWYEEHGSGEPLLLLHPGGADSRAFGPNLAALAERFHVFLVDRRGHGHTPDTVGEFTFELMADDTINFIEQVVGGPARLVGYSDGAIVALQTAIRRPDLVERLVCVAGVFNRNGWEDGVINPGSEPPEFMADSYGEVSPDGKEHYSVVAKKLDAMHAKGPSLSTDDLGRISCRTLVMVGDDDEPTFEHTIDFYRSLPNGELAVVPGTSHGLLPEKPDLCNKIIIDFLSLAPIQTYSPIRRA